MIYAGQLCPLCDRLLDDGTPAMAFPMLGIDDAAVAVLDDGAAHAECIQAWPLRDRFVAGYNAAAERGGWGDRLAVSSTGEAYVRPKSDAIPDNAPDPAGT